jgi:Zn-dependent peptidase ImmA (M78 family)
VPRITSAEQKATDLLTRLGIDTVPVPVEAVAERCGAHVTYERFEGDISGMLLREDGRTIIGVNSWHAHTRQRFTIAHEIGHLEMHPGQPVYVDREVRVNLRAGQANREESQANAFAAELLMPRGPLRAAVDALLARNRALTSDDLIGQLAERFEVSTAAMQYRLMNVVELNPYLLAG